jgi:hypothetical protein
MNDKIKVGDELAFHVYDLFCDEDWRNTTWVIHRVERITPSGRIKCGPFTLKPDLSFYGANVVGRYAPVGDALPLTDETRTKMRKTEICNRLVELIYNYPHMLEYLPSDDLERMIFSIEDLVTIETGVKP